MQRQRNIGVFYYKHKLLYTNQRKYGSLSRKPERNVPKANLLYLLPLNYCCKMYSTHLIRNIISLKYYLPKKKCRQAALEKLIADNKNNEFKESK